MRQRHRLLHALREFFDARDFLEVETPVWVSPPALEEHIDAVRAGEGWLRTSPELHMKRLVQAGCHRLYQIGPCFRAGERGRRHRPEFTMLEWYEAGADYRDLMGFTRDLMCHCAEALTGQAACSWNGARVPLDGQWQVLTVAEAFTSYARCSVAAALANDDFERLTVERIEPALERLGPVFLVDYPAELAALARLKPGHPELAERWELYVAGLELANAYSELVDPDAQRRRFRAAAARRRAAGREAYPLDERFLAAMVRGMPEMAGCALGVDRLQMLLTGAADIAEVKALDDP